MQKTFIGPHLRRLRQERGETQAQMARTLGISASYVNLLENNERSVSVTILFRLMEAYGVDWREIAEDESASLLPDLRTAVQDPLFTESRPDLPQLRAALVHSPDLAQAFLRLHRAYQQVSDQLTAIAQLDQNAAITSPEAAVHHVFRRNRNHFRDLEQAASGFWGETAPERDEVYGALKVRLKSRMGVSVRLARVEEMPLALRDYDEATREICLSEALDHTNRIFQLTHMCGLLEQGALFDQIIARAGLSEPRSNVRLRVELANYFAAAVLMPYDDFLQVARSTKYDFDHLATRFGVSFEQACHRATTLQRDGAQGVPFFFLRIDKGGNVAKRFNATSFPLAEHGGACPRLDVHTSFRTPGRIVPQFVEMPDRSRFFVFARTVDRPTWARHVQDNRLAVAMGCAIEHVGEIGYAEPFLLSGAPMTPVGINCRICPRTHCDQRAHQALIMPDPGTAMRRGATRYDT
ncbi:helix-turn-helix domain-containing protein [Gemmobacter denitrificans]|uniref:Short-chain fatty acyl-CoA regulator family protein n=1 Tax=Gemmobacter denitrificans TaxID=3123040 RepID=A0ABU8BT00_9RHOB